jgi:hygromycin-B 7''-O-kinase
VPALPQPGTPEQWDELLADDAALRPGVDAILQTLGLSGSDLRRYDSGSMPVYAVGTQQVLKLYPPPDAKHAEIETQVLAVVDGRLPLRTPQPLASGTADGWRYLLMSTLPGRRLVEVWAELDPRERDRLCDALGQAVAALHALDFKPLGELPWPAWQPFMAAQRASAVQRQRKRGLDARWLEQVDTFLDAWAPAPGEARSLLHTEIMREHLMVEQRADGWHLSGLFDFEPAMPGEAAYEFASIGLFVSCGDGRLLRRILLASGHRRDELDEVLPCRLMAQALLHRYSNLRWYLQRLPLRGAVTLEQLARHWFGFERQG